MAPTLEEEAGVRGRAGEREQEATRELIRQRESLGGAGDGGECVVFGATPEHL